MMAKSTNPPTSASNTSSACTTGGPLVPVVDALFRHSLNQDASINANSRCNLLHANGRLIELPDGQTFSSRDLYPLFLKVKGKRGRPSHLTSCCTTYLENRRHPTGTKEGYPASSYDAYSDCEMRAWRNKKAVQPKLPEGNQNALPKQPDRLRFFTDHICGGLRNAIATWRNAASELTGAKGTTLKPALLAGARLWLLPLWKWDPEHADGKHHQARLDASEEIFQTLRADDHVDKQQADHILNLEVKPLLELYCNFGFDEAFRSTLQEQILFYLFGASLYRCHLLELEDAELTSAFGRSYYVDERTGMEFAPSRTAKSGFCKPQPLRGSAVSALHGSNREAEGDLVRQLLISGDSLDTKPSIEQVMNAFARAADSFKDVCIITPDIDASADDIICGTNLYRNLYFNRALKKLCEALLNPNEKGPSSNVGRETILYQYAFPQLAINDGRNQAPMWVGIPIEQFSYLRWVSDDADHAFYSKKKDLQRAHIVQNWSGFCRGELIALKRAKWGMCRWEQFMSWMRATMEETQFGRENQNKIETWLEDTRKEGESLYDALTNVQKRILNGDAESRGDLLTVVSDASSGERPPLPQYLDIGTDGRMYEVLRAIIPLLCSNGAGMCLTNDELWGRPPMRTKGRPANMEAKPPTGDCAAIRNQLLRDLEAVLAQERINRVRRTIDQNKIPSRRDRIELVIEAVWACCSMSSTRFFANDAEEKTHIATDDPASFEHGGLGIRFNELTIAYDAGVLRKLAHDLNRPTMVAIFGRHMFLPNPFDRKERPSGELAAEIKTIQEQLRHAIGQLEECMNQNLMPKSARPVHAEVKSIYESASRFSSSHIFDSNKISRWHAAIMWWQDAFWYVDLGSTNGTIVKHAQTTTAGIDDADNNVSVIKKSKARAIINKHFRKEDRCPDDMTSTQIADSCVPAEKLCNGDELELGRINLPDRWLGPGIVAHIQIVQE